MEKGKTSQKGAGRQHPGTEQVRSGTNLQRGESERIQAPKVEEQQKPKQEQSKSSRKSR